MDIQTDNVQSERRDGQAERQTDEKKVKGKSERISKRQADQSLSDSRIEV